MLGAEIENRLYREMVIAAAEGNFLLRFVPTWIIPLKLALFIFKPFVHFYWKIAFYLASYLLRFVNILYYLEVLHEVVYKI